jgi:SAM-dependent methyltransferase
MNEELYRMYAEPTHKWNIRERGGMLLGNIRGQMILDYGSGMGEESIYLAKMGGIVTAIDISEVGIEITRQRAIHNNCEVSAQVMDVTNTSFESESYDVIHGYGILHHIGLEVGLAEVRRLLKPGGRAVFFEHMENSALIRFLKMCLGKGDYTSHEQPVRWEDCERISKKYFRHVELYPYYLLGRLRRTFPMLASELVQKSDYCSMLMCPFLKYCAGSVVLSLEA